MLDIDYKSNIYEKHEIFLSQQSTSSTACKQLIYVYIQFTSPQTKLTLIVLQSMILQGSFTLVKCKSIPPGFRNNASDFPSPHTFPELVFTFPTHFQKNHILSTPPPPPQDTFLVEACSVASF